MATWPRGGPFGQMVRAHALSGPSPTCHCNVVTFTPIFIFQNRINCLHSPSGVQDWGRHWRAADSGTAFRRRQSGAHGCLLHSTRWANPRQRAAHQSLMETKEFLKREKKIAAEPCILKVKAALLCFTIRSHCNRHRAQHCAVLLGLHHQTGGPHQCSAFWQGWAGEVLPDHYHWWFTVWGGGDLQCQSHHGNGWPGGGHIPLC